MLAVKTGSKRMTKAYSKISGYDRPHVYVFVSDKKISTLESVCLENTDPENIGSSSLVLFDVLNYVGFEFGFDHSV